MRWCVGWRVGTSIRTFSPSSASRLTSARGLLFGFGRFFWAGIVLIVANLFDMLDGQVARLSGRVTSFGGFLDSSLDRLSDMVVFVGLDGFLCRATSDITRR